MRILLISDTHTNTPAAVDIIRTVPGLDVFFHMGDTYADAVRIHQETSLPMRAVSGNMDGFRVGPEVEVFDLEGWRVLLTHGDRFDVNQGIEKLNRLADEANASLVCFGHTHRICDMSMKNRRFLNPGSLKGTGGTYGLLTLGPQILHFETFTYNR